MKDNKENLKEKVKNESYMQVINLSERLMPVCIFAIIVTAIIACVDIILVFANIELWPYMLDCLDDFQIWTMILVKIVMYAVIILIEVVLTRLAGLINKLASTIFRFDENKE